MLAVLEKGGSKQMLSRLMNLAKSEEISANGLTGIYRGIASLGGPAELRQIFEPGFHLSTASQAAAWRHSLPPATTKNRRATCRSF